MNKKSFALSSSFLSCKAAVLVAFLAGISCASGCTTSSQSDKTSAKSDDSSVSPDYYQSSDNPYHAD